MNTTGLGALALAILGIWLAVSGATMLVVWQGHLWFVTPLAGLVWILAGATLVRIRTGLARSLFGADNVDIGKVSTKDAEIVGLALLGVWLVARHVPDLILAMGTASMQSIWEFAGRALGIAAGGYLVLRGERIARMWSPTPSKSSEGDDSR